MQPRSFIYVLSVAAFTELNSCNRDYMAHKVENIDFQGFTEKVCQHHPLSSLLMPSLSFQNESQVLTLARRPLPASLTHLSRSSHASDTVLSPPLLQAIVYVKPFPPVVPELPFLWMLFCSLHDWLLFLQVSAQGSPVHSISFLFISFIALSSTYLFPITPHQGISFTWAGTY